MIAIDRNLDPSLLCRRPNQRSRWDCNRFVVDGQVYESICLFFWHNFITIYDDRAPGGATHTIINRNTKARAGQTVFTIPDGEKSPTLPLVSAGVSQMLGTGAQAHMFLKFCSEQFNTADNRTGSSITQRAE